MRQSERKAGGRHWAGSRVKRLTSLTLALPLCCVVVVIPSGADGGTPCKGLVINTHFGELLEWQPTGLCCPARRAMIHASPYSNYRQPDTVPIQSFNQSTASDAFRVQYAGAVLLQDSKLSLGVNALIDRAVFAAGEVVQMWLLAFYKPNCASAEPGACVVSDFFVPSGGGALRHGNVMQLLQTGIAPVPPTPPGPSASTPTPLTLSSFHMYPIQSMVNSVGYELHIVFLQKGLANFVASDKRAVYDQLYTAQCVPSACAFGYPAVFPARVNFGVA